MVGHSKVIWTEHGFGLCAASLLFCLTILISVLKPALASPYCISKISWLSDSFKHLMLSLICWAGSWKVGSLGCEWHLLVHRAASDLAWFQLEERFPICLDVLEERREDPASLPSHRAAAHAGVVLPGLFTESNGVSAAKLLLFGVAAHVILSW